jgi:hypothetical protein
MLPKETKTKNSRIRNFMNNNLIANLSQQVYRQGINSKYIALSFSEKHATCLSNLIITSITQTALSNLLNERRTLH